MANGKDVIYIDVDDEITTVIDKVRSAKERIVALVLPKRATTFQSSVNMKLLKRTADEVHKKVVLITSESGLTPLAAAAGLHVATTLQSKPEVPTADEETADAPQTDDLETVRVNNEDFDPDKSGDRPVGELAAAAGTTALRSPLDDDIETLDIEDEKLAGEQADAADAAAGAKPPKKPKNKKLHVPNFNRFRLLLSLGVLLLIILIVGGYFALSVLPKATIDIKTDSMALASNLTLTLDTTAKTLDPTQNIVPAQTQQEQKTYSQQVPATGQKNQGQPASGTVTMTVTKCGGNPFTSPSVPQGAGVSEGGLTFITQKDTSFSGSGLDSNGCYTYASNGSTPITSIAPGTKYNVSNVSFSVSGVQSNDSSSSITSSSGSATGSASGGTDKMVTVVSQDDVNAAEKKLGSQSTNSVKQDLTQQLTQDGLFPVSGTFTAGTPSYATDSQVGDAASNVTVTETITYVMYGVKESDLQKLVDANVQQQIDPSKQVILSEGLDNSVFKVTNTSQTSVEGSLTTTAIAGPDLRVADLKKQIAGKKSGDIQSLLKGDPGVTGVDVHFSPFWVTTAPKNLSKITINLAKPVVSKNGSGS